LLHARVAARYTKTERHLRSILPAELGYTRGLQ
jgi:hypothetical protein